jgi:hypothetical protein
MTTDEDDNYHQQSIDSTPEKTSPKQQQKNEINHIYDVRFHSFGKHFHVLSIE